MSVASVIGTRDAAVAFGGVQALADVSFDLGAGEIRALCGENGAGKSTLVKLLTGIHQPTTGTVTFEGRPCTLATPRQAQALGVAMVSQELSLCPDLSVLDNIWLGGIGVPFWRRRARLRRAAQQALAQLGAGHLALDRPVGQLSLGERQLVEIARMLTREARVLILDEPSATLSDIEIERMFAALLAVKRQGRSIIYVTHRLMEVFQVCDSVTVMLNGRSVGTHAVADLDRDGLIEMMLGRKLAELYPDKASAGDAADLTVDGLHVAGCVTGFAMQAAAGSITCIAGQVGSGAADVVAAMAGLTHHATGRVAFKGRPLPLGSPAAARRAGVQFISGDRLREGIFSRLSLGENLVATRLHRHVRMGVLNRPALRRVAATLAGRVGVDRRRMAARAQDLSGGNQQKLAFGRCLDASGAGVLLMNEPTRGIDVGARADIYRLMRGFCDEGHALVIASTDLEEVLGVADMVITMHRGRVVGCYPRAAATMHRIVSDISHPAAELA